MLPKNVALEYRDSVEQNIKDVINKALDDGIAKDIRFNGDYTVLTIRMHKNYLEENNYDTVYALGFTLSGCSSLYQAFSGVPIKNQQLHYKMYVGGKLSEEETLNFGAMN